MAAPINAEPTYQEAVDFVLSKTVAVSNVYIETDPATSEDRTYYEFEISEGYFPAIEKWRWIETVKKTYFWDAPMEHDSTKKFSNHEIKTTITKYEVMPNQLRGEAMTTNNVINSVVIECAKANCIRVTRISSHCVVGVGAHQECYVDKDSPKLNESFYVSSNGWDTRSPDDAKRIAKALELMLKQAGAKKSAF